MFTFPTSTLPAGLFTLSTAPVKLADLATIPETALIVMVRAMGTNQAPVLIAVDGCAKDARLLPEQSVEFPLDEMDRYSFFKELEDDSISIVVTFTHPMSGSR